MNTGLDMWKTLLRRYWQVALFKESPANTPYSPMLLIGFTLLFFVLIILQWLVTVQDNLAFLPTIVIATSLVFTYYLYTFLLLKINKTVNRSIQTITTLLAVHFIIHFLSFPLLLLVPFFTEVSAYPSLVLILGIIYLIATVGLTVWQFLATAFIYRYALDIQLLPSLLASFGLMVFNMLVVLFW
ncbi:MAG: hypothetical protein H2069_02605 [Legionella sp.]|nr:hypothetical protein [Legionella sp.]